MAKSEVISFNGFAMRPRVAKSDAAICVGDALRDCSLPDGTGYAPHVRRVDLGEFLDLIAQGALPETVYSAVVSDTFDCIDIAQVLHRVGYRGQYRVIAPQMPKPGLIRGEVRAICPGLDFHLVTAPPCAMVNVS